jgi:hypothetical protein
MKEACFSLNYTSTLNLAPWKTNTPSTPKFMNLEAKIDSKRPPYYNIFIVITLVRLFTITTSTIQPWFQWQ